MYKFRLRNNKNYRLRAYVFPENIGPKITYNQDKKTMDELVNFKSLKLER